MDNLRSGDRRITIKTLQSGQIRNYAPIVYQFQVFFEYIPYVEHEKGFVPYDLYVDIIKPFLRTIHNWKIDETIGEKRSGSMEDAFHSRLTELVQLNPGVWQFTVTEEFCD